MDFPKCKDDLKQNTEKYLRGLLEVGTIDYGLYSYICDEFDSCINMAFELGKQEGVKKMKTKLKRKLFDTSIGLCNFVNEYKITKENIQSIVEIAGSVALFYWEITE